MAATGAAITGEIKGMDTVQRAMDAIAENAGNMPATHTSIAALIVGEARANAPHRTGWLASTISGSGRDDLAELRASAEYGGVIEWGWRARGIRPSMYLTRAVLAHQDAILAQYVIGLSEIVAEAQSGGG